jgi:hypothetical protein
MKEHVTACTERFEAEYNSSIPFCSIHSWNFIGISYVLGLFLFFFLFAISPWSRLMFNSMDLRFHITQLISLLSNALSKICMIFHMVLIILQKEADDSFPPQEVCSMYFLHKFPEHIYRIPMTLFCMICVGKYHKNIL